MDITVEDMKALTETAAYVREATGLSYADSLRRVKAARDLYQIDLETYVSDRLYLIPAAELSDLTKADSRVQLVSGKMKISYGRAFAIMVGLRDAFGLQFREFVEHKFYKLDEGAFGDAVRRFVRHEAQYIQRVCAETGWPVDKAEEELRRIKRKWPVLNSRSFAAFGLFAKTDDEIEERLHQWNVTADEQRRKVASATGWSAKKVRQEMTRFKVEHDLLPAYYVAYKAWDLTDEQIESYARMKHAKALSQKFNVASDTKLLAQKDKFNVLFKEFVNRRFWVNESTASFESFVAFADGLDEVFCKPLEAGGGFGAFKLQLNGDAAALREEYDELMSFDQLFLVEQLVEQHPLMNEFYSGSVNTVRVVSILADGEAQVICAQARFGREQVTDNYSIDGLVADVDIETGTIVTQAVNKKGDTFSEHPVTGKQFVGFQLPLWQEVLRTAQDAMHVLPGVNFVGWDIAIGPSTVSIIEGGSTPDLVLMQAPYAEAKIGRRHLLDSYLKMKAPAFIEASSVARETAPADSVEIPAGKRHHIVDAQVDAETGQKRVKLANGLELSIEDTYATVVSGDAAIVDLEIPEEVDGVPVRFVSDEAFKGHANLASVVLPGTLSEVGRSAFSGCADLKTVVIEDGVELLRARCFEGCASLENVNLPETLGQIHRHAFASCKALAEIELPDQLEVLNRGTFKDCTGLRTICLPYGLRRIGTECFRGCTSLVSTYYYSKRGISDVMVTDRDLKEEVFPTLLEYIGPNAFQDCVALERIDIPYMVKEISPFAFQRCRSLRHVGLHNTVRKIGTRSFRGAISLESLRLPVLCKEIGENAFSPRTTLVVNSGSFAAQYAKRYDQPWRGLSAEGQSLVSTMRPGGEANAHESFYSEVELEGARERFEIREPSYSVVSRDNQIDLGRIPRTRFDLEDGVYKGKASVPGRARLMMAGDLMARFRQQKVAIDHYGFQFDFSFSYLAELLKLSDFAVANLEMTVCDSAPYTLEAEHVNARPHLNSPSTFLAATRRAGFDGVTHAQNHIYDSGVRGVFETLDSANKCQLIHTGAYASPDDPRYLVIDIDGIKVGIVAYLDSARQMMKKANFTREGRSVLFPYFEEERIREDIAAARTKGAEFIVAFCHWGREYTAEVTQRQRDFAQLLVEAGADYLVGAHSHCVQPYEVLESSDGRIVPCLWSAGNLVSDINLKPPITRDTLVLDITLERGENGGVSVVREGYHPFRIMNLRDPEKGEDIRNYVVVPTSAELEGMELREKLWEAHNRIVAVVGDDIRPVG